MKIKFKIILVVAFLILLVGSIIMYFSYVISDRNLTATTNNNAQKITLVRSREIQHTFQSIQKIAESIAGNSDVVAYLSKKERSPSDNLHILSDHLKVYSLSDMFSAIYLMDGKGITQVSTDPTFIGNDYSFRDYFVNAISGKSYVEFSTGVTSKAEGYYFSAPVKSGNKIIGVSVVKLIPERINEIFKDQTEEENYILTDEYGVVIFSNKKDQIYHTLGQIPPSFLEAINRKKKYLTNHFSALDYEPVEKAIIANQTEMLSSLYDEEDQKKEILAMKKIEPYQFYLIQEIDAREIIAANNRLTTTLGIVLAVSLFLLLIGISFFVGKLLGPISNIKNAASSIGKGNLDEKLSISTGDEFQELSEAINEMAIHLKESQQNIQLKVKEQTATIFQKNLEMENQQKAVLNILDDVKKEKENSDKLAAIIFSAEDAIYAKTLDGVVTSWNQAAENLYGYAPSEIIGKSINLIAPVDKQDEINEILKKIKKGKKTEHYQTTRLKKDGITISVSITVSPIKNSEGEIVGASTIARDNTREKNIDRMKTEFISLASHQLRTPLSAMKWFGEMLLNGDAGALTKEQKEFVENIYQSNERMIELVNSLLNSSRIESGRIIVDPKPTNLSKLLDEVLIELKNKIAEKKQNLVISIHPDLPMINIDPKLIREVYKNLLTNAIKYTPAEGEIQIFISLKENEIISQITDNGYGIPTSEQAKTFHKFYRGSNIVKLETEGTGLGLYLAKAIVESSGGKLWFESKEHQGTTFWLSLPLVGSTPKSGEVSIDS
jgi:PAS domain S-box-containing protein